MSRTWLVPTVFVCLLLSGMAWRFPFLGNKPMLFHPMLHYENALVSRVIWYKLQGDALPQEKRLWLSHWQGRFKATPVIETITAMCYSIFSKEAPVVGRALCSILWIINGLILFRLCMLRNLEPDPVIGLMAMGLFLLHPFGIIVSTSFQHESIMLFGFLVSLWILSRWQPLEWSWRNLLLWIIIGLCLMLKPGFALFPIMVVGVAMAWRRFGLKRTLLSPVTYVMMLLFALPSVLYVWLMLDPSESEQIKWHLLEDPGFYDRLVSQFRVTGLLVLVLPAVLGALVLHRSPKYFLGWPLWIGYIFFASVFNYANMTHDYYLTILFPCLCLHAGYLLSWLIRHCRRLGIVEIIVYSLILLMVGQACASLALPRLTSRYEVTEDIYHELGEKLGYGTPVISLNPSSEYGMPLQYYGHLNVTWWPTQVDFWKESLDGKPLVEVERRLRLMLERFPAEYFIILEEEEFEKQHELQKLLNSRYSHERIAEVLVYRLNP